MHTQGRITGDATAPKPEGRVSQEAREIDDVLGRIPQARIRIERSVDGVAHRTEATGSEAGRPAVHTPITGTLTLEQRLGVSLDSATAEANRLEVLADRLEQAI